MKNKILAGLILILVIMVAAMVGLYQLYYFEKSERKRFSDNFMAVLTNKANQQELTFKELKNLYPRYDSIARELGIKTKNITSIIETRYHFRDTTLTKTLLHRDSLTQKRLFTMNERCYSISGYVNTDTIVVSKKELNDKLITFLYKDWQHRYFFQLVKTKPFYTAKTYSDCLKDTISVENNIQILKRN